MCSVQIWMCSSHRQTISCYYVVNETTAVSFGYKPRGVDFAAQVGQGHLDVKMKLAYGKVSKDLRQ